MKINILRFKHAISVLTRAIIFLLLKTSRFRFAGYHDFVLERVKQHKPMIFVLWHNSILGCIGYFLYLTLRGMQLRAVASQSKDGEIISEIITDLTRNVAMVRGSSRKGGSDAFDEMLDELKQGHSVVITVDGPLGPKFESKTGAIRLAGLTGAPIVPFELAVRKELLLRRSWDNSRLPLPFNRGFYLIGKPIFLHREITNLYYPQATAFLNSRLLELTAIAQKYSKKSKPIF